MGIKELILRLAAAIALGSTKSPASNHTRDNTRPTTRHSSTWHEPLWRRHLFGGLLTNAPTKLPTATPTSVPTTTKRPTVPDGVDSHSYTPIAGNGSVLACTDDVPALKKSFGDTTTCADMRRNKFCGRQYGDFCNYTCGFCPTASPTGAPTRSPTTRNPTHSPTVSPSRSPTTAPTVSPTVNPTGNPTTSPTSPTARPSATPTTNPSASPSTSPSASPTSHPTTRCPAGTSCGICLRESPRCTGRSCHATCPSHILKQTAPACSSASVHIGDWCEGDGECGTNPTLNNCPGGYDVYQRILPSGALRAFAVA